MFDNTFYASQTGGVARDWNFSTPPVTQALANTYIAVLSSPAAKLCSGDILQLPTMCSPELPTGKPTRAAVGTYVVLDFMLHEVQPVRTMFRYVPGDTLTGESFSRSTTATYHSGSVTVGSAAINVKRDAHYIAGVRTMLLEDTRTNLMLRSQEFDHAAWTKTATVVANSTAAPDGTTTAELMHPTTSGDFRGVNQGAAVGATTHTASVYAKASGFSWFYLVKTDGSAIGAWFNLTTGVIGTVAGGQVAKITSMANGWYRCTLSGATAAGTGFCQVGISDADNSSFATVSGTNGVYVWGGQLETAANEASSYIPTTTATVARGVEFYSLPFTETPKELSVYVKFIEKGTAALNLYRLFQISNAANATPQLACISTLGEYATYHHNGSAAVQSDLGAGPSLDQSVELLCRLFGDGSVDITQSINSAAATTGAVSAANALATAWSGQLLWLNSAGTAGFIGYAAFQSVKIVAGVRTLDEMRLL